MDTSLKTPSCWTCISSDSDDDAAEAFGSVKEPILSTYNNALDNLSKLSGFQTACKLEFQLNGSLENASRMQKAECVARATEACKLVCNVIAPDDGETLFNSLPRKEEDVPEGIRLVIDVFAQAPTRNLKTQILSIYTYEYSAKKLQNLHELYAKLSKWQIKRARAHAKRNGPGFAVIKPKKILNKFGYE